MNPSRNGNGATRVIIANEHPLLRAALRDALVGAAGLDVVSDVGDDDATLARIAELAPEVAVVDAALPARGGIETCAAVKAAGSPTRVLVLGDGSDQRLLLAAVEAGADGYLSIDQGFDELLDAVRRLDRGEAAVPPRMLGTLLRGLIGRRREEDAAIERFARLSKRERQIVALLAEGIDQAGIAEVLVLSPSTARTHIRNVLEKLKVHSRIEAVALALDFNLLERFPPDERLEGRRTS